MASSIFCFITNSSNTLLKGEYGGSVNNPYGTTFPAATLVANAIELTSFHLSAESSTTVGSGGTSVGKLSLNPTEIVMPTNQVSPQLFLAQAQGQSFTTIDVLHTKSNGTAQPQTYLAYRFGRAFAVSYDDSGSNGDGPVTRLQFVSSTVQIAYRPQNNDGSFGAWTRVGWDLARAAAI